MQPTKNKLPREAVVKIFMTYYGAPCKFKPKGASEDKWQRSLVNEQTLINFDKNDNCLLLKPLYKITASQVKKIHQLMSDADDQISEEDLDLSEQGIRDFCHHIQESIKLTSFVVSDYLRREGFMLPLYGVNLFKANIASVLSQSYRSLGD